MKFTPVTDPAPSETTAAIEPTPALQVDAVWQRQRFTTGRAVSAPALIEEQDHRAGRSCMIAQALRPGVLAGLEVELGPDGQSLVVSPGAGLCADGQDVTLPAPMSIRPEKLPVRLCAALEALPRMGQTRAEPALSKLLSARGGLATGGVQTAIDKEIVAALPADTLKTLINAVMQAEGMIKSLSPNIYSSTNLSTRFSGTERIATVELSGTSIAEAVESATTASRITAFNSNIASSLSTVEAATASLSEAVDLNSLTRFDTSSEVYQSVLRSVTLYRMARSPQVCVLVLEPVEVEIVGDGAPTDDPCQRDIEAEAFEDKRRVDATRAVWVPLEELFDNLTRAIALHLVDANARGDFDPIRLAADFLSACFTVGDDSVDRNRLVWGLFNMEDGLNGLPMPWAEGGVPVALACFASDGSLMWVDRAAVVRRGGHPGDRSDLLGSAGGPPLWQARIEQFNEQLVGLPLTTSTRLNQHFRYLPPVGILPLALVNLDDRVSPLFPERYGVGAAPVPIDELDAIVRRSAALGPVDLGSGEGDELRMLVPVRREAWEPGLLRVEAVPPDFHAALDAAERRRDAWLRRRAELRAKLSTLRVAVGGVKAALSFSAEEGDEQAERVASQVLWDNAYTMGLLQSLGALESGALLSDLASVRDAAKDMLGAECPYAVAIGTAALFADLDEGALAVVDGAEDATVEGIAGKARRYAGGWTHPLMADERGIAVRRDAVVVVVPGTLDSDALERAQDSAGQSELVILTSSVTEIVTEQLVWLRSQALPVPLVVRVPGGETAETLLRDDRSSLGLYKRTNLDEYVSQANCQIVVADYRSVKLIGLDPDRATTPAGAAVIVPPTEDDPDAPAKARYAAELLRTLRQVEDAGEVDSDGLLRLLGGSTAYGTYPEATGLYPVLLDELVDNLEAQRTPQPGGYGSSTPLTDEQLQNPLVAHNRPRVFQEGVVSVFAEIGLDGFMREFRDITERADDLVDFSFLQVQTATYRVREDMLGRDKATRMASSPVLAELSDMIRVDDSPAQLAQFFTAVRAESETSTDGGDGGGGGSTGGSSGGSTSNTSSYTTDWLSGYTKNAGTWETQLHSGVTDPVKSYDLSYAAAAEYETYISSGSTNTDMTAARERIASESNVTYSTESTPTTYEFVEASHTELLSEANTTLFRKLANMGFSGEGEAHSGGELEAPAEARAPARHLGRPGKRAGAPVGEGHAFLNLRSPSTMYLKTATPIYTAKIATVEPETVISRFVSVSRMVEIARKVKTATPVGFNLRKVGIFERVQRSRAVSARQTAFRLRATVTQSVRDLDLYLEGVRYPGFVYSALPAEIKGQSGVFDPQIDVPQKEDPDNPGTYIDDPASTALVYAPLTDKVVTQVLKGAHDPVSGDVDAGSMYSDAIRSLETTSAMLRIVEARIAEVREAITDAQRTRAYILRAIAAVERALETLETELAEARHDVAVTQALLSEEQERVDAVNARRAHILAKEVPFVVYHRVRVSDALDALPTHDLEPVFDQRQAIAAALQPAPPAPEELREMVELARELPARHLRALSGRLSEINRVANLRRTLELSQARAQRALRSMPAALNVAFGSLRGRALTRAVVTQRARAVATRRTAASSFQLAKLQAATWQQAQVHARELLSVGDLIDSAWASASLSRLAAAELERMYRVAAHLYAELCLVAPELRARWSLLLSEHDRPLDLSELSSLPGWTEVGQGSDTAEPDPFRKRELQLMVTWLHGRVSRDEEDAVLFVNDLIRVCVLLASHAPVGEILSGYVDEPTPILIGARVPIRIDPSRLRVGMAALLTLQGRVRARAVVEDLGQGRVFARVVTTDAKGLTLDMGAKVRFTEADGQTFPVLGSGVMSAVKTRLLQ
ncbi:MAG: hypothetical protein H6741_02395 [Alphaproteobacteria bacterium]|nr:hypothetical protein [Alphaproteobacteria bacterium]MCB9791554.1 hypothetical protein [Alphaproteobacteria bacterium]